MLTRHAWTKIGFYIGLVTLGVLIGLYLGTAMMGSAQAADAARSSETLLEPNEPMAQHVCTPENVAVFTNRIHIKCTAATTGGILYFALSTTDSKHNARILSLLLTAKASGQRVGVDYNPSDLSGGAIGCNTNDCRLIRWAYIVN